MLFGLVETLADLFRKSTTEETQTDHLSRFQLYILFFKNDLGYSGEYLDQIKQAFEALGKQNIFGADAFLRVLDKHLPTYAHLTSLPRFKDVDVPDETGRKILVLEEMITLGPTIIDEAEIDEAEDDTAERNYSILREELARLKELSTDPADTVELNAR